MENSNNLYGPSVEAFARLLKIMDELRLKCPWDQKQTLASLRPLTLEEVHELSESILENNLDSISAEIGDVLLHLVFYAKIGSELEVFTMEGIINKLCEKLIYRHPHIYGNVIVNNEEDVKKNWEQLKLKAGNSSVLGGVPSSLPSLIKAMRIQEKAAGVGFDWPNGELVWEKVVEELEEFHTEAKKSKLTQFGTQESSEKMEDEFGDILFSLINYARFMKINPDNALEKTSMKFIKRFSFIETKAKENSIELNSKNSALMENWWKESKLSI